MKRKETDILNRFYKDCGMELFKLRTEHKLNLHMQASFAAVHNILSYSIHHFLSQFKPEEREIPLFFRREMCYSLK